MGGCIEGVRVLELARYQAGPRAGLVLSDLGAEVIKLEQVGGEETRKNQPQVHGTSIYFTMYNRGKKSATLDLRKEQGKELFRRLVPEADVVLENFRPGVLARLGFPYETLKALNPSIILASVSGFGQYGPYKDRPAFDPIGQAMSGLMYLTGRNAGGRPIATASSIIDRVTALHACIGILGALYHRQATGEGQHLDVCLLDSGYTLTEIPLSSFAAHGTGAGGGGYAYQTKDGYVTIMGAGQSMWGRIFKAIGREDVLTKENELGASLGREATLRRIEIVEAWTKEHTTKEAMQMIEEHDLPGSPVYDLAQAHADPHWRAREIMTEVGTADGQATLLGPGLTVKFSKTMGQVRKVPAPGEHNDYVYRDILSLTPREIEALKREQVI